MKIKIPKVSLSKSQSASVGIVGYFVGRAILDTIQTGKMAPRDLFNAGLAGVLAGARAVIPSLSGLTAVTGDATATTTESTNGSTGDQGGADGKPAGPDAGN